MLTKQQTSAASSSLAHNLQPQQLLVTRTQAAQLLACSVATVIRLEANGDLPAVRINRKPNSKVYYRRSDVWALAQGGTETRAAPRGKCGFVEAPTRTSITPSIAPSHERECSSRKKPSLSLLDRVAAALAIRADKSGLILFRDPLSKLVREALADEGYQLSDRHFRLKLWNRPEFRKCSQSGRRTQKDRDKFNADAPELQNIVRKLARESTQARCLLAANYAVEVVTNMELAASD